MAEETISEFPSILGRPVGRPRILTDQQREANRKAALKKWRQENREHSRAWDREYNKLLTRKLAKKQWYKENKDRINERQRELYKIKQEAASAPLENSADHSDIPLENAVI